MQRLLGRYSPVAEGGETLESRIARLEDEAAIRSAIALYGRAIDRGDALLLAKLFHPDAQVDYGPDVYVGDGAAFVPAVLATQAAMVRTQHMLGQSVIFVQGEEARVETYSQAIHILGDGEARVEFASGNRYLDLFQKREGQWRIGRRQVVLDWLRELRADEDLFDRLRGPALGGRGGDDPSASFLPI